MPPVGKSEFPHVPLKRTFAELSSSAGESDESDLSKAFHLSSGLSWDALLRDFRVVVLSEAGSGKTEEFRTITMRLRGEGKDAFFLRLENIPENLETAFDVGALAEFEDWLGSTREGWLFLDSVDEARLRNVKDFDRALRLVSLRLKLALDRTHIFLSSRMSAWRPKTDLDRAIALLPFTPVVQVEAPAGEDDHSAEDIVDGFFEAEADDDADLPIAADAGVASEPAEKKASSAPFRIVTLEHLSREQVEVFAQARGVSDTKSFGDAIDRADALSFAALPQDLEDLVTSWLKRGQIGSRREIMEDGVERRLRERDEDRAESVPLTPERALEGARLLAAVTTLARNPAIQVPDGADGLGGIPVEKVLVDWSPAERKALLERPIFDAAIYGAVRFHHRSVREYLTAEWLREMLLHPTSRRAIEDMFFRTQYGVEVVVPVMRPVLPWVALYDARIREHVRRIAPEVLFEGGDPVGLPYPTRKEILGEVVEQLATGHAPGAPTDFAAVQRFAHDDLGDDIRALLQRHAGDAEAASFLLRMVWIGVIRAALPEVRQQALLATAGKYQRAAAFRTLKAVGSDTDMRDMREALLAEPGAPNREWLDELVDTLEGSEDDIGWLLRALTLTQPTPKHTVDHLQDGVARLVTRLPVESIPALLDGLFALLGASPFIDASFCKISTRYGWALLAAATAVDRLMEARDPAAMSASALGVLGLLPSARDFDSDVREAKADFRKLVPAWPELNRCLFWSAIERARGERILRPDGRVTEFWQAQSYRAFWSVRAEDFDYFNGEIRSRAEQDDRLVALSAAFRAYILGGRMPAARTQLKQAVAGNQELEHQLQAYLHPPKRADEMSRQERDWKRRAAARARLDKENLVKSRENIAQHLDTLRDPGFPDPNDISRSQWYLHHQARDSGEQKGKWTTGEWTSLIPDFGEDIARAYRDGAVRHWRRADTQLRSEGALANTTSATTIFALTGLAIDARETPDWEKNLSPADVVRAWRFATHELNGFPEWFPRFYAAHTDAVTGLLIAEVEYELGAEPEEGMHRGRIRARC